MVQRTPGHAKHGCPRATECGSCHFFLFEVPGPNTCELICFFNNFPSGDDDKPIAVDIRMAKRAMGKAGARCVHDFVKTFLPKI
jgi:hypothetical protein